MPFIVEIPCIMTYSFGPLKTDVSEFCDLFLLHYSYYFIYISSSLQDFILDLFVFFHLE